MNVFCQIWQDNSELQINDELRIWELGTEEKSNFF